MSRGGLPWKDALRILRKRQGIVSDLSETALADSIQAFLAWKAFVIVARGTTPTAKEKNQCQELLRLALGAYPQIVAPADGFVRGLEALARQSDAMLEDWYCEEDWEQDLRRARITQARRRVRQLGASRARGALADPSVAYDLGQDMYAVRSAVIAHASVNTSGNLFPAIVGPFGQLAAVGACAGIALRSGTSLERVMGEAHESATP